MYTVGAAMKLPGQASVGGRVWSEQQQAIFRAFRQPAGHVLVRARAGCAKTTTSLEGVKQAPERRILVAAFNKLIAFSTRILFVPSVTLLISQ